MTTANLPALRTCPTAPGPVACVCNKTIPHLHAGYMRQLGHEPVAVRSRSCARGVVACADGLPATPAWLTPAMTVFASSGLDQVVFHSVTGDSLHGLFV